MAQSPRAASHPRREPLLVDLALQGGGAHGAFTWGVLDRLLEEPWLRIEGVSATSAGAMNAALLAYGHHIGGAEGAKAKLQDLSLIHISEPTRLQRSSRMPSSA